jgi:hypothetical protein
MHYNSETLDRAIDSYLETQGISYEPFHFCLNEKLKHANRIKTIINRHVPFSSPSLDAENLNNLKKLQDTGIV